MPFDPKLLPESFRPAAQDISERMQVPLDFPGISLILTLAGTVNRRAKIQPKANDDTWEIIPNLWGGLVAPPGFMKSPTVAVATQPLRRIEDVYRQAFEQKVRSFQSDKDLWELQKNAYKQLATAALKNKKPLPDQMGSPPEEPKRIRFIINDATFESLHEIMAANPAGIFIIRDELSGFWAQLDRAGREGERAFHLQAWNGDTGHTIDRIGRGSIYVPACCESMLGGIQPSKLRSYLTDTLKGGPTDDGLIQRFQLMVWPDIPSKWVLVDRAPSLLALNMVEEILRALAALQVEPPLKFRFSNKAQELFNEWLGKLEKKVRSDDIHPALAGHLSKYRKTMPALALLFELADQAADSGFDGFVGSLQADSQKFGEVTLQHAQQAAACCEYLESHARRIYSCVVTPQMRAATVFAAKIREGKVGSNGVFVLREVYLKGWSGLDSPELAQAAALVLQDAGWIRALSDEGGSRGGRPANRFEINPKVRK
jgi:putative DNA primase/helicase